MLVVTSDLCRAIKTSNDHIEVLANDLAAARKIDTHAKLSSKAATEVKQTKRHLQWKRSSKPAVPLSSGS